MDSLLSLLLPRPSSFLQFSNTYLVSLLSTSDIKYMS